MDDYEVVEELQYYFFTCTAEWLKDGGTFYKIGEEISWGRVSQEWHLISNTFSSTYLGDIQMAISSRQLERRV